MTRKFRKKLHEIFHAGGVNGLHCWVIGLEPVLARIWPVNAVGSQEGRQVKVRN
jgi:hypothetical protein